MIRVVLLKNGKYAAQKWLFGWKFLDKNGSRVWTDFDYVGKYCLCDSEEEARKAADLADRRIAKRIRR